MASGADRPKAERTAPQHASAEACAAVLQRLVRAGGTATQTDLVAVDLSPSTVSKAIRTLEGAGWLVTDPRRTRQRSGPGAPRNMISVNPDALPAFLGLNYVAETHRVHWALTTLDGTLLNEGVDTYAPSINGVTNTACEIIGSLSRDMRRRRLRGVGSTFYGHIDGRPDREHVFSSPGSAFLRNYRFTVELEKRLRLNDFGLGAPLVLAIENDVKALASYHQLIGLEGAQVSHADESFLVVKIFHGVGGALGTLDGNSAQILHGRTGLAGEVGHVIVEHYDPDVLVGTQPEAAARLEAFLTEQWYPRTGPAGPYRCATCSHHGCVESLFRKDNFSLALDARAAAESDDVQAAIHRLVEAGRSSPGPRPPLDLATHPPAVRSVILDVVRRAGRGLGRGLAAVGNIVDVSHVIVVGDAELIDLDEFRSAVRDAEAGAKFTDIVSAESPTLYVAYDEQLQSRAAATVAARRYLDALAGEPVSALADTRPRR
jgi:predicted NBD/HSP70 family sugar kinase